MKKVVRKMISVERKMILLERKMISVATFAIFLRALFGRGTGNFHAEVAGIAEETHGTITTA